MIPARSPSRSTSRIRQSSATRTAKSSNTSASRTISGANGPTLTRRRRPFRSQSSASIRAGPQGPPVAAARFVHSPPLMGPLGAVALFNSNPDAVVRLGKLLESAGFEVVSALIPQVRDGRCDVNGLMERYDPVVVVYDIGAPYEKHWALFEHCRATAMQNRRFVITSDNPARVEQLAGRDER